MTSPMPHARVMLQDASGARALPRWQSRTGLAITALCGFFLIFDAVLKLVKPPVVVETTVRLGYSESVIVPLGIVLLISTVLYLIPRTRLLGAILLTGYLGGATATHVRAGQPFVFPILVGMLAWAGIALRSRALQNALFTGMRSDSSTNAAGGSRV